jgi:hypothetical protein
MEKLTSRDRSRTARGSRTGPVLSIAAAVVGLVAAVIAGAYTLRPIPNDGEPHPLGLYSLIEGATSPFTLALIGAVIADLIVRRRIRPAIAG